MNVSSIGNYNNLNYNYKKEKNPLSHSYIQNIGLVNKPDKLYKKINNNLYNVYFGVKNKPKKHNANFSQEIRLALRNIVVNKQQLINHTSTSVDKWLQQFEDKDKLMALKLLDNFEYISLNSARSIFKNLHMKLLSQKNFNLDKTFFSYFGEAKSGGLMAYLYSQAVGFRDKGKAYKANNTNKKFYSFSTLEEASMFDKLKKQGKDTMVIVDDIIDNGESASEFLTESAIKALNTFNKIYYITLFSNQKGINKIKSLLPNVEFMSYKNIQKYDDKNSALYDNKDEIYNFIRKYSLKIEPDKIEKYKNSKIFITFDWNTPGNTPMPFSYEKKDVWKCLFRRYNGLIDNG